MKTPSFSPSPSILSPSRRGSAPDIAFSKVLLPAPFGPKIATVCPWGAASKQRRIHRQDHQASKTSTYVHRRQRGMGGEHLYKHAVHTRGNLNGPAGIMDRMTRAHRLREQQGTRHPMYARHSFVSPDVFHRRERDRAFKGLESDLHKRKSSRPSSLGFFKDLT